MYSLITLMAFGLMTIHFALPVDKAMLFGPRLPSQQYSTAYKKCLMLIIVRHYTISH
jgi:hypothetical protein